jgi:hypothetical protein
MFDIFPKLKNYEIKLKKERTSEQCPEFVKKKSKKAYTTGKIVLMTYRTPDKPYRH